jgi:hypothetical protein
VTVVETRDGLSVEGEAVSGFEIDGERYEVPRLDTITLDEERVLYIYADTVIQDFAPAHPEAPEEEQQAVALAQYRKVRNPDFKRALAHIAYRRRHPDVTDAEVEAAIGKANALEVDVAMLRGDDDSPPAMTSRKQPESRSDTNGHSRPGASGRDTASSSDPAAESREPTGTTESDTSSPGAVPIGSGS